MSEQVNQRKMEHLRIAVEGDGVDRMKSYFDAIHLNHRALPEIDLKEVDTSTSFLGKPLSFPLVLSSMTGGTQEEIIQINQHLAIAAEKTGVAMAVGSQRVLFSSPSARASFDLRPMAPHAVLIGNMGAVQLNYGFGIEECRACVEVLKADALYLHLNAVQEAVQPEGNTNFAGLAEKIGAIVSALEVPVIIKEVGAGLGREDVQRLIAQGVKYIDIAGTGGTSWSRIEHFRHKEESGAELGRLFQDWGHPTPLALRQISDLRTQVTLLGSGGIRTGIDMVKAMILGASLCGIARPFLTSAKASPEAVITHIEQLKREFTTTLFLLGIKKVSDLIGNENLILKDHPSTSQ